MTLCQTRPLHDARSTNQWPGRLGRIVAASTSIALGHQHIPPTTCVASCIHLAFSHWLYEGCCVSIHLAFIRLSECCHQRLCMAQSALEGNLTQFVCGGGGVHVDMFVHNKSDIACQDRNRRPGRDRCPSQKGTPPAAEAATKLTLATTKQEGIVLRAHVSHPSPTAPCAHTAHSTFGQCTP
jgi:hypothetical protein